MTFVEFARAFLDDIAVAVLITDATLVHPGPTILYANAAFGRLNRCDPSQIIGRSPRFMQGKQTRRTSLDAFRHALISGARFHGFLTNYRSDGTRYRVEIDCRPCFGVDGTIFAFVSFQREVTRRRGRPASGQGGRYTPDALNNLSLTDSLRALAVFDEF